MRSESQFGFLDMPAPPTNQPSHSAPRLRHPLSHRHAGLDWPRRPRHQPRCRHGGARLAQHLRLQHVLLPHFTMGRGRVLRTYPSPACLRHGVPDNASRPCGFTAEPPAPSCAGPAWSCSFSGVATGFALPRRWTDGLVLGITGLTALCREPRLAAIGAEP